MLDVIDLPSVSLQAKQYLPAISAVYFVRLNNQVLYIGQAKDLRNRWRGHDKFNQLISIKGGQNIRIGYIPCEEKDLNSLETKYIKRFCPTLNVMNARASEISKYDSIDSVDRYLQNSEVKKTLLLFWSYLDDIWTPNKKHYTGFSRNDLISAFENWSIDKLIPIELSTVRVLIILKRMGIAKPRLNEKGVHYKYHGVPYYILVPFPDF